MAATTMCAALLTRGLKPTLLFLRGFRGRGVADLAEVDHAASFDVNAVLAGVEHQAAKQIPLAEPVAQNKLAVRMPQ